MNSGLPSVSANRKAAEWVFSDQFTYSEVCEADRLRNFVGFTKADLCGLEQNTIRVFYIDRDHGGRGDHGRAGGPSAA